MDIFRVYGMSVCVVIARSIDFEKFTPDAKDRGKRSAQSECRQDEFFDLPMAVMKRNFWTTPSMINRRSGRDLWEEKKKKKITSLRNRCCTGTNVVCCLINRSINVFAAVFRERKYVTRVAVWRRRIRSKSSSDDGLDSVSMTSRIHRRECNKRVGRILPSSDWF